MTKANDLASLLDANGDVVSSALDNVPAAPTPSLSSLGIPNHDDITVDGSGNVGLGGSPSRKLHIIDSGDTYVAIQGGTSSKAGIFFGDSDNHTLSRIRHDNTDNSLQFSTNEIERMRISGGNLLVGTTDTVPSNNGAGGDAGLAFTPDGAIRAARSGNNPLDINRMDSDGDIAAFRKDGSTVGSIGSDGGKLVVNSQGSNLVFAVGGTTKLNLDGTQFYPQTDGGLDLGHPSVKWKDLRLSGGVYLGGTGSANYLDDYEEGTWTPTTPSGSWTVNSANYVKVGKLVHCNFSLTVTSAVGAVDFYGLPFSSNAFSSGVLGYQNSDSGEVFSIFVQTGTVWNFRVGPNQKGAANSTFLRGSFHYTTDA